MTPSTLLVLRTPTSQLSMCHPDTSVTLCPRAIRRIKTRTLLMAPTASFHLHTTLAHLSQASAPTHTRPPLTTMPAGMARMQRHPRHHPPSPSARPETSWCV